MNQSTAFWVDERTDRERTRSYAELLTDHLGDFDGIWGDIAPVAFTCAAWQVAIPPATDPGFVRWHRRVLWVNCERNAWDGSLNAHLAVVSPLPAPLIASRTWWHDRGWREWPEIFGQFVMPGEEDLAKIPFVRPVLHVDVPIPLEDLPPTPGGPGSEFAETAQRALLVVVRELNHVVGPIIAALDAGGPPATSR